MTEERYGDVFFQGIKTIRHSRFSHYLITNEWMLEIGAMKSIYLELASISDRLDELRWGILYPIYRYYKSLRFKYRRFKYEREYQALKRRRGLKLQ